MKKEILPLKNSTLRGEVCPPADKSIAQRAVIISSIAEGITKINNFPFSGDPLSTLNAVQQLGPKITKQESTKTLIVESQGVNSIQESSEILNLDNSGTGFRLLMGLLAGLPNNKFFVLNGDSSLKKRPMKRVAEPLIEMGAQIIGRGNCSLAPIALSGRSLKGGFIRTKIPSAQLKSAVILSCLNAENELILEEPQASRNHTEIMLKNFGANIKYKDNIVELIPSKLKARNINIPGDISGAAFLIAAASLIKDSSIKIKNVGLNSSRTGFLQCLEKMGAKIKINYSGEEDDEELIGNIEIEYSKLKGIEIKGDIIPNVIDEIPILALVAAQAEGKTVIKDAKELRVKESDRLKAIHDLLSALGIDVQELEDGLIIKGNNGQLFKPKTRNFNAKHDHRIVMITAIAGLLSEESIEIEGAEWADVSFPCFFETIEALKVNL